MNNLYEVLEICLQDIEQGADIETVLFRYPDLADELRSILEASMNAKRMAIPAPSAEVIQRNRAKVLQHASQMREAKANPSRRIWFASLRRLMVTLAVVVALFVSGTGLVRAASTTLPGDNLYPVKRTWEDMLVAFTFNVQQRDALEVEHENERLQELQGLFAEKRSAQVDFAGTVTGQSGTEWVVSGVTVMISAQTEIRDQGIVVGSPVRVKGQTQSNNVVSAERIELLPSNAILPDVGDKSESETENHGSATPQIEDNSGKGSEGETPTVEDPRRLESTPESGNGSNNVSPDSNSNDSNNSGSGSNNINDGSSHNSTDDSGGGSNSGSGGHD